jgi:hypothetical protein
VADQSAVAGIFVRIDDAESTVGTVRFVAAYKALIEAAAPHIALVAPFIPALTKLMA